MLETFLKFCHLKTVHLPNVEHWGKCSMYVYILSWRQNSAIAKATFCPHLLYSTRGQNHFKKLPPQSFRLHITIFGRWEKKPFCLSGKIISDRSKHTLEFKFSYILDVLVPWLSRHELFRYKKFSCTWTTHPLSARPKMCLISNEVLWLLKSQKTALQSERSQMKII